jgi:shikimate dehydrogenase
MRRSFLLNNRFNLGLLGYPLGHSFSPIIQSDAFRSTGLDGEYKLYPVNNDQVKKEFATLFDSMRSGDLHGLNVTVPYKRTVMDFLDGFDQNARTLSAVNTVKCQNGELIGFNTDSTGFERAFTRFSGRFLESGHSKKALVFGAGGSARAVSYVLVKIEWNVTLVSRNRKQARSIKTFLKKEWPDNSVRIENLSNLSKKSLSSPVSAVINCTPVGMFPDLRSSIWPEDLEIPDRSILFDLVYNPLETRLMNQWKTSNQPAVNGIEMLVEQAADSFEIWTGSRPSTSSMKTAIAEYIEQDK